ncbi:hypothetical protein ACLD9W_08535 [Neisseria sp. WLZKY-1]
MYTASGRLKAGLRPSETAENALSDGLFRCHNPAPQPTGVTT